MSDGNTDKWNDTDKRLTEEERRLQNSPIRDVSRLDVACPFLRTIRGGQYSCTLDQKRDRLYGKICTVKDASRCCRYEHSELLQRQPLE